MKRFLLPQLICPACLPREESLQIAAVKRESEDDIDSGRLACPRCRRSFDIKDGIARLIADPDGSSAGGQFRYEEAGMVDRYLWSHYAEFAGIEANSAANSNWSSLLSKCSGPSLDAGCAVGRLTFEMAAQSKWAVGCDLSLNFVRTARRLAKERSVTFSLPMEGNLRENFSVSLPENLNCSNIEFVVADALRLPFIRGSFSQGSSLNLLDRVSHPLAHLYEINRVITTNDGRFIFASPFSWAVSSAPENLWLGGTVNGEFKGSGIANVKQLLQGRNRIIQPSWTIVSQGSIQWQLRSHSNHRELISSQFLVAER